MASPASDPSDEAATKRFGRNVAIGCVCFLLTIIFTVATWVTVWNREANAHRDQIPSNGLTPAPTAAPPKKS